ALNDLVGRHEIWRTTFPAVAGSPVQRIHAFEPFTLVVEEVSREEAQRRIEAAVCEPFDLGALPLVRWRLFRVGPAEHWLLHSEHHLLHDGWAWGVALGELFALYDARAQSKTPSLPPLPVQFADFAAWQRDQVSGGHWQRQPASRQ